MMIKSMFMKYMGYGFRINELRKLKERDLCFNNKEFQSMSSLDQENAFIQLFRHTYMTAISYYRRVDQKK